MATFKITTLKQRADGFFHVYIRVTQNRQSVFLRTDKMVTTLELDKSGNITDPWVVKYCTSRICDYQVVVVR